MNLLPVIDSVVGIIDKFIPDKGKAQELKAQITLEVLSNRSKELEKAVSVINTEANGHSWLQRNWRPLVMVFFAGLVGAHWLGFTPENLGEAEIMELLSIVKVGIGGYVLGRSGEKIMKEYKSK